MLGVRHVHNDLSINSDLIFSFAPDTCLTYSICGNTLWAPENLKKHSANQAIVLIRIIIFFSLRCLSFWFLPPTTHFLLLIFTYVRFCTQRILFMSNIWPELPWLFQFLNFHQKEMVRLRKHEMSIANITNYGKQVCCILKLIVGERQAILHMYADGHMMNGVLVCWESNRTILLLNWKLSRHRMPHLTLKDPKVL